MKIVLLILFFFMCTQVMYCQSMSTGSISSGIGIGSVIAVVTSWSRNKSVLWAIFHGILGWFYVIYYVITRS